MSTQRFLQTKFWTEFKARHSWKPYYFSLDENKNFCPVENECDNALCVLVRSFSIKIKKISIAYIPMAPEKNDLQTEEYALLCNKISTSIKNYLPENTICIRYDFPIDFEEISEMNNFCKEFILIAKNNRINIKKSLTSIQPPDTTVLNLTKTEEELLAGMKNKWRYNIKLASKKNVIIEKYNYQDSNFAERFEDFYKLFEITSKRDGVSFHDKNYYLDLFAQSKSKMQDCELPEISLYLAKHEDDYLAGIITLFCKKEAVYLYGASGNIKRNLMASYLLQWTAIKAAKEYGCPVYDFYGIPPVNDEKHPMHGLYLFKTGFGGRIIHRCGSFDIILNKNDYTLYSILEKIRAFYFKKLKKYSDKFMCAFYENGLKFECNGCSYCCRFEGGVVLLSNDDLERLSRYVNLTSEQFKEVYCRILKDDSGKAFLVLKTLLNGDCIFWNKDLCSGKGGCSCYEVRPIQCSTYPFWTKILSSEENWNKEKSKCPGINKGTLNTKEEIEEQLSFYKARIPLNE